MKKVVIEIDGVRHGLTYVDKEVKCSQCSLQAECESLDPSILCSAFIGEEYGEDLIKYKKAGREVTAMFAKEEPLKGLMKLTIGSESYRLTQVPLNESACTTCALSKKCVDGYFGSYLCEAMNGGPCHAKFVKEEGGG